MPKEVPRRMPSLIEAFNLWKWNYTGTTSKDEQKNPQEVVGHSKFEVHVIC